MNVARRTKTNPHELQTKLGVIMAAVGTVCALVLCAGVLRRFSFTDFAAYYVAGSLRFYGILGAAFVAGVASTIGFFVSLNAAGQKRNRLSSLAWKMFFVNAVLITITLCVFFVFWRAKEEVYPTTP